MRTPLLVTLAAVTLAAGCGSSGTPTSVPAPWRSADRCLQQVGFAGNVEYDGQTSGAGWHGTLDIGADQAGFLATAHRYRTARIARHAPNLPHTNVIGTVAVTISAGTSPADADAIFGCF